MRLRVLVTGVLLLGCAGNDEARTDADSISPAGAASGSAAPPSTDSAARAARPAVLLIGTSLTAGLGLEPEQAYPAVLQRMADSAGLAVEIVNAGSSGETSAGALRRVDWLLDRHADRARVVVIETGANDGLRALDPDSTRRNLVSIVRAVKRRLPDAHVMLVQMEAPPNLGERYTQRFRAMFPEVAREEGVELLPFLLEGVAGEGALNQGDGIHPNEAGAVRVAKNLWPGIQRAAQASRENTR
jgi:acyl-CoA thioesterase I